MMPRHHRFVDTTRLLCLLVAMALLGAANAEPYDFEMIIFERPGGGLEENLVKECAEEAAVPAELDPTLRSAGVTALTLAHLPLALVEGVFTAMVVLFLREVQPDLLHGWRR